MIPFLKPGFQFKPTRQHLLLYLQRKVAGHALLPSDITGIFHHVDDFYGDKKGANEPWNLFNLKDKEITGQLFYVFTTLKKVSNNSRRITRRAGSGSWSGRTAAVDVKDFDGDVIGFDRYYVFEVKDGADGRRIHGKWTMHEFSLNEKQSPGDAVICVIGCGTAISIPDKPRSSVEFFNYFEGDQCLKTLKRKKLEEDEEDERRNSRKRACFSSAVDYNFTDGNFFADQFLDESDFPESSEMNNAVQEQQLLLPAYDSFGAYESSTMLPFSISAEAEENQQQVVPFHTDALLGYDPTAAYLFADQFLSIPDNDIGVFSSSLSPFEDPAISFPLCDSMGAYHSATVQPLPLIWATDPVVAMAEERQL